MPDVIVIGGGVIGLSIAWELAGQGLSVRVLDKSGLGQEASWAGAGMLPPGNLAGAKTSEARFRGAAHQLWPDWSHSLVELTGCENEYHRCGGLEVRLDDSAASSQSLENEFKSLIDEGVVVEREDWSQLRQRFPALGPRVVQGFLLPEFCQVRNPRHLVALQEGCRLRRVELVKDCPIHQIEVLQERIVSVKSDQQFHHADQFIFCAGAWSAELLQQVGAELAIEPVRGQIVLLKSDPIAFSHVIQVGREYLVPRQDGRVLIGSTEERVGFDKRNTAQAVGDLIHFAGQICPALRSAGFEKCWAGLRPFSATGRPYIGRLPHLLNGGVAAGHYRYGLQLSPVTAIMIRQILLNQPVLLPEDCLSH